MPHLQFEHIEDFLDMITRRTTFIDASGHLSIDEVIGNRMNPSNSSHKFLVCSKNRQDGTVENDLYVFAGRSESHDEMVGSTGFEQYNTLGGGGFYLTSGGRLVVGGDSDFYAVPAAIAAQVSKVITAKLNDQGIQVKEVRLMSDELEMNPEWRSVGYHAPTLKSRSLIQSDYVVKCRDNAA